jgi:phosphotransferase system HPr-like phosphotransfer protein
MKIVCRTFFDCSYTGVIGHFRSSEIPFVDQADQQVTTQAEWHRSRNQQRNWETLMQIIGLRTQPQDVTRPECKDKEWVFEFVAEASGVYSLTDYDDPLAGLKLDCNSIPMIVGLNEQANISPTVSVQGPDQNIWFETINNILE